MSLHAVTPQPVREPEPLSARAGRLAGAAWRAIKRQPLVVGMVALAVLLFYTLGSRSAALGPLAEVREGPFRVALIESGTLQALRSISYASTIQSNQAKIVALAPEGKWVAKGDLLILFDATPFEEEIRKSQAALSQAEADLERARQELRLQDIQNKEEIQGARQKTDTSALELRDTEEGKGKLKEAVAEAAVANAERELIRAQTGYDDLKPLLAAGFITRLELERAEQLLQKMREDLDLAQRRRSALIAFARPLELGQAQSGAIASRESLRQAEIAAGYRTQARQAAVASAESRIQEAASKLAQARQQLARTEVRADVPGIVVYRDVFFGSEQRKPQVGDQVWANQPLLILPDISKTVVETKIREVDIHKVQKSQRVAIRVDAYPELRLSGTVTLVGALAQEERERKGAKFFGLTVEVNEKDPRLRPGMTARVEIDVEKHEKVLYVPIEAVFERAGRSVCYVPRAGQPEAREVTLGPSNADFVVISKGLERGERVLLRDPWAGDTASAPR